ncbi:ABC transporter substrate-binding protein [Parafrigoribacterium soli]|uniref:ABC transporter substrate-binding protein n=1 Tax=Parafrigoribacterium soli TaxID=3144663 RepID=UPI0032ECA660
MNSGTRRLGMARLAAAVAAVAALSLALAACAPEPKPVKTSPPPTVAAPSGDGILRIGTLFPTTGTASFIGPAQVAGVEVAVKEINLAGGVLGKPVEVLHRDSGDASTTTAETSFADLVAKKTDVIIGPSSSVLALRLVPKIVEAKVAVIATAATAPALSDAQDAGLLSRTIPSDALEGTALGQFLGKTKGVKAALVYFDDDQGNGVHGTFAKALKKTGGTLVTAQKLDAKSDVASILGAVTKTKPDVVVVTSPFTAIEQNKAIITGLNAAGLGGAKLWLTGGAMADYSQAMPNGALTNVNGILEGVAPTDAFKARVKAADPNVTDYRFAAEAYDATILAALAASSAKDDSGASLAGALRGVSEKGIKCLSCGECREVLKTQSDIDYDGATGLINFDAHGDPQTAHFGVYKYDGESRFQLSSSTAVG